MTILISYLPAVDAVGQSRDQGGLGWSQGYGQAKGTRSVTMLDEILHVILIWSALRSEVVICPSARKLNPLRGLQVVSRRIIYRVEERPTLSRIMYKQGNLRKGHQHHNDVGSLQTSP